MTWGEKTFLVVVAMAVLVALALIRPDPKQKQWLAQPSPVDWENVQDDPTNKLYLRWQGIIGSPGSKPGSWIERNLEERFHVELDPIFMDANTYERRRPLMLVGGDIPDVMWSGDPLAVRANIRNGFIMEVPREVILKHCPTYVRMVNTFGKEAWLYANYMGRNYGLPTVNAPAARPRLGSWRMDWLRNVGIEKVPETVEEMHEALRRFRFDDPDGDGRQDTYGWTPSIYHWSITFAEVFAAYDVLAFEFMERDGRIVWGGLLPETREALRVIQSWYTEGLIDPDFVLDSQGRLGEEKFINGRVGYLYPVDTPGFYQPDEPGSLWGKVRAFDPRAELEPGPPLRDQKGQRRGRTWGGAAHVLQFGRHLEKEPEKVIRVLTMMEAMASNGALYLEATQGKRGYHWDYNPKEYIKPNGRKQRVGIVGLPPFDEDERAREKAAELLGGNNTFFFPCRLDPLYTDSLDNPADHEWYKRNARPEWGMKNKLGKSDVVPSSGRYLHDLMTYQTTFFIEIVIGRREIAELDTFVSEWRRRGGDILLKEANEMYGEIREIYDAVGAQEDPP